MKQQDTILVIDMQKVYLPGNPWACERMKEASENIGKLLDRVVEKQEAAAAAPPVLLTRFIAAPDTDARGRWQEYNRVNRAINENPVMNEFIPEIARYAEYFPYYDKSSYSCYSIDAVRAAAARSRAQGGSIVLTGVVAECCVLASFFQGTDAGDHFIYLTDACAGINEETEQAVKTILQGLMPLHVELMTTEEYL